MGFYDLEVVRSAIRDMEQVEADLFLSLIKGSKHWAYLNESVIDAALLNGEIMRMRDIEDERAEAEEKLVQAKHEADELAGEVEVLRAKLDLYGSDLDRLQELIVSRQVDEALHLLRELAPEHQFLSPAAEAMLAGQRSLL
ncbi:hypothetical protein [Mesorhizobium sp.]|uniref:hypothetical protein n=1 Tax=Mesorhizobium sp. TaxID=1871066 RepID=UPI000FE5B17C|nr:hypothetical protein [Mesorhizobium sp.]RWN11788.1 MAG: hypothetical protein EOR87_14830 [Mesorhizobium sp.]RWN19425.1 MAG: hypothetical protein EOR88_09735 [Mesorhizobium sp.]